MRNFELSSKRNKNGRRKFKAILYEIFPDSCINEVEQVGTQYQDNGLTWIRKYCEAALPSIQGMSLRVEFLDDERTEICGHGLTDYKDGLPIFEDATVIGVFEKGYIDEIVTDDGETKTVCIGEGTIDGLCYSNFCERLDHELAEGNTLHGSVEILRTNDNDSIVYLYGYKEYGRIPVEFEHSGYALLGIRPADATAKLLEINSKEDMDMDEAQIKSIVSNAIEEYVGAAAELNTHKEECNQRVQEINEQLEVVTNEKNEAIANSEQIQKALEDCRAELNEKYEEISALHAEMDELRVELGKAKAKERIGEMNAAIANFSDEEKAFASEEIAKFNEDPEAFEINSIVAKIYEGIGKKSKEEAVVIGEQNSFKVEVEDIFGEIMHREHDEEDTNIF